jgi:hypothetical protein
MLARMKPITAIFMIFLGGLLAGRAQTEDTTNPPARQREMTVPLFNQKDFSGWTFCMKGDADPLKTWSVTNGVIHCTGTPAGYLRTTEVYSNYFLTVVWRFVKVTPKANNTGILVHMQPPDEVWPRCVQIQGKHGHQGDIFLMNGAESKEHKGKDANTPLPLMGDSVEVPVGEWNKAEIICVNHKVECFINSRFLNETTECNVNSGYIGFQSEGGEIEIRSVNYTPLKY